MRQRCRVSTLSLALCLLFGFASLAQAQATQVKPWFLIVFDTSGSMSDATGPNSCGYPANKMGAARCAVRNIINSTGDAEFGLMQFDQTGSCGGDTCGLNQDSGWLRVTLSSGNTASLLALVDGSGSGPTDELCAGGGTPLGGVLDAARDYLQGTLNYTGTAAADASPTATDTAVGCRPVSVILLTDGAECCGSCSALSSEPCPGASAELGFNCERGCVSVPACGGDHQETAPERAHELFHSTNVPKPGGGTVALPIRTYPIGFGITPGDVRIEHIARAGHTNAPGANFGFYANDETALSAALNQIILESQLTETCDGTDNDCDTRVDEGYPKYCDFYGIRTSNPAQSNLASYPCNGGTCTAVPGVQRNPNCAKPEYASSMTCSPANLLCTSPGERCNQNDDDCDGTSDEGAPPLVGVNDGCDLVDTDCDGTVDENCNPSNCVPESCDNADNDCDTRVDEGLSRRCGTDVGDCVAGDQICQAGQWGAVNPATMAFQVNFCPDTKPGVETCNNEDDDCDGIIDRITRPCSPYGTTLECTAGVETCIAGVWQSTDLNNPANCIGAKGPSSDICDSKNNDCNTSTPDGSMDSRVGQTCGNDKGICNPGTTVCTAGNVTCNDPDESQNEVCDGNDNDCDGKIDENPGNDPLPNVGDACYPGLPDPPVTVGECRAGMKACVGGALVCQNFKGPSAEICDTLNNDCNVSTADGSGDPRVGQSCGTSTGECDPGTNVCTAGSITCSGGKGPVFEVCDGKDNDCDFKTDEDTPDTSPVDGMRDADVRCDVSGGLGDAGACEWGERQCVQTGPSSWAVQCIGGVGPVLETCDGEDNDCDGATDECAGAHNTQAYMDCVAGTIRGTNFGPLGAGGGKVCGTGVPPCQTGLTKCVADVNPSNANANEPGFVCVGNVAGMNELCNNADDDCDTKVDEDLDPANDPRLEQPCSDGVTIPACREPAMPAEPCGRCKFGRSTCVAGVIACTGQVGQAMYESCNGTDDDCDGTVDECVDPSGANCGNTAEIDPQTPVGGVCAAGQCQSGINKCVDGKLTCEGVVSGATEICNNLDDDCDGSIDEGFNKGAPCTESGEEAVGECRPGMLACDPGDPTKTTCINERKPVAEECNSLDDDCDRIVDEGLGLGDACGSEEGLCMQGKIACVRGRNVCTGEVGPRPETCDCEDNDCDGKVDEESGDPLCPSGQCIMCQCALPCSAPLEFAARCPQGKAPIEEDGKCFCVGEQCKQSECQESTIEQDGEVRCKPDDPKMSACLCRNNECTFQCAGRTCEEGLVCDPTDGRCKQATCLLPQFACEEGQRCTLKDNAWSCVDDACKDVSCGADEACRDGDCIGSCGKVTCQSNQKCVDGTCEANRCQGVTCEAGLVCDPANGDCVLAGACVRTGCGDGQICDPVAGSCDEDPCLRTRCPRAEKCNTETGQCEPRCFGNLLLCDEKCVNPMTSRDHCGASDDCAGDNAGQTCAAGLVCSQGECSDTCSGGLINCRGECVDPVIDNGFCGASGDCRGDNDGQLCKTGTACKAGKCESINPGGGNAGSGGGKVPDGTRVIASGGGGCTCSVPGGGDRGDQGARGPLASLLLGLLAAALVRRRRRSLRTAVPAAVKTMGAIGLAAVLSSLLGSGCKVDTFCLDCPKPGEEPKPTDDGGMTMGGDDGGSSTGGTGGTSGRDSGPMVTDGGDAEVMRADGGCVDTELCNGLDDDCDGKVDEDTDPAAVNIDVNVDPLNCGRCGNVCSLPHAFNECVDAKCTIDPDQGTGGCDIGFYDLDGDIENGCEYRCTRTADDDTLCDLVDNDCDGQIDEDVDFKNDPLNCDSCGFRCTFARAAEGGLCVDGNCVLDSAKCDEGYTNVDGQDANGCEYKCPVFPTKDELCNFVDDDCDHDVDEDVSTTDPEVGKKCGSPADDPDRGACVAGHQECQAGVLACVGSVGPAAEVCDGVDNDCDGVIDTDHPDLGLPCGDPLPGSECTQGTLRIPGGASACAVGAAVDLECFGGQGPVAELCDALDNDCDGKVDEAVAGVKPGEGQKCINSSTGMQILTADPPQWTAATVCRTGSTVCVGGGLVCRNEIAPEPFELCDALDQDCDGDPLNGFTFVGGVASTGPDGRVGDACGVDTGECAFGTLRCHQNTASLECDNQTLPVAEICNGKDDDCDGTVDDADPTPPVGVGLPCIINSSGMMQYGAGITATLPCRTGTTVCAAGAVACPNYVGPTAELCDSIDQDCDGTLAEASFPADTRINASCDSDNNTTGVCNAGTQYCDTSGATPQIRCMGEVMPSAELCDGLDNDCDGQNDDGAAEPWLGAACKTLANGSVMLNPPAAKGTCTNGTAQCVGGHQTCVGETGPALETCNVLVPADLTNAANDQDCDGVVDEDFFLSTNLNRCGRCNNDCVPTQPNANMVCTAGMCQISSCKPGYYDSKLVAGPDCSLNDPANCTFTGQEICDGKDNDCDAIIDETSMAEPMFLPDPVLYCLQLGKCATSTTVCRTHKVGNLDNTSCTGTGDPTCITEPVCTIRPVGETCNAPYNMETSSAYDDDCDGVSDSVEFNLSGSCTSTGAGACATAGNLACNLGTAATTDTYCVNGSGNQVQPGTSGNESAGNGCDNIDQDCDGKIDEACGVSGSDANCVNETWVTLPSGTQIYPYEASRRDATSTTSGVSNARACSAAGRRPWADLTWDEADAACAAAGARLCTEEEWQSACRGGNDVGSNSCNWSYSSYAAAGMTGCNTYSNNVCNGLDFTPSGEPIEPTGWTGSPATSSTCYRPYATGNVFDLSGNIKEYVDQRLTGTIPLRGGAYNNPADGISCGFNFTVWPNPSTAKFPNVGFRCCKGAMPPRCVTVKAADTLFPVANSGGDITSTLTVALESWASTPSLTDVNVVIKGFHTDFEGVELITLQSPGGTTVRLLDSANVCSSGTNGYDLSYDDQATPTTLSCTVPIGQGIATKPDKYSMGNPYRLSAFNGQNPAGVWTLSMDDREGTAESGSGFYLDTWQLTLCGN